jgi:hypothetical protein
VTARIAQAAVAAAALYAVSVSAGEIMDVDAELAAMRREVAALRRASDESWADGVRAEQVRAVVRDVLSDASTRTAWRGGGAESLRVGYEPGLGFVMGDPAGGEMIRAFGFVQTRFVWNSGYDAPERTPAADDVWGMEVRRAQLFVTGNVGGPDLTWLIGLAIGSYTDPESLQALQVDPPNHPPNSVAIRRHRRARLATFTHTHTPGSGRKKEKRARKAARSQWPRC